MMSPSSAGSSPKKNMCQHPVVYRGMRVKCTQNVDDEIGVAFGYINKHLRAAHDEVARLREKDLKNLLSHKKLYLVLDLDHTLLNSARFPDITTTEGYLYEPKQALVDNLKDSLHRLKHMQIMMTKLRPRLFEMCIFTMGERAYALEMAKLLDPQGIYFNSRVIAKEDCTESHRKGLDIILGHESAVLILDDTAK
ncbi:hypothetical protein BUALT_Bualt19G0088800 [Buddleja alternifolia]|uniref:protein-serine/threonine phosphatase n=1 Tax=Buddleja alternifolia TaxID=168488 RepID=A0AAV6W6A8_9LAMI|nr:hypothetical protein BUALT_Bualt19G0088800 [Buddleja alternifolia]